MQVLPQRLPGTTPLGRRVATEVVADVAVGAGTVPPLPLTVLGVDVQVRCGSVAAREQVRAAWSRCSRMPRATRPTSMEWSLSAADSELPLTPELLTRLVFRLTDGAISRLAGDALMLHAAAVTTADGEVIALVAPSGVGKTTLANSLCQMSGGHSPALGYVTDETVAVLPGDRVPPFPKPLSVVIPGREAKSHYSPDELSLATCPADLRLSRIVLLQRDPAHVGPPVIEAVDPVTAMLELIGQTSAFTQLAHPLGVLADVVSRARPVRLIYREADSTRDLLPTLVTDQPDQARLLWQALPISIDRAPKVRDAIGVADEALLMIEDTPVRLSALGRLVWCLSLEGRSPSEITEAARRRFGSHPQSDLLTVQTMTQLRAVKALGD